MSDASGIQLVCFDLGGVLVRMCDNWRHACQVARLSIELPAIDDATRQKLRVIIDESERGQLSQQEFCIRAAGLFGIDACHVAAMSDIYLIGAYPGTGELLDQLHESGHATACLSNTNENHWRIMFDTIDPAYRPLNKLQHRFGSQLIGVRKPNPAIYEHVERTLSLRGDQIAYFDDLPENVEAARSRGWIAHQILKGDEPVAQIRRHLSGCIALDAPR